MSSVKCKMHEKCVEGDNSIHYTIRFIIPEDYTGFSDIILGEDSWEILFQRGIEGDKTFFSNLYLDYKVIDAMSLDKRSFIEDYKEKLHKHKGVKEHERSY